MTPEQKLRTKFDTLLKKTLPKGRYLLQSIETNTVGVPDFYLAYYNKPPCWIETKTTDYKIDRFQMNWAHTHLAAGQPTYILTHIPGHTTTRQQPPTIPPSLAHTPQTSSASSGLYILLFDSKMLDSSTLGSYIRKEQPRMVALEHFLLTMSL